jgi:hypothetical protein
MLSVYRRKMKFFCEVHPQKLWSTQQVLLS